jgi:hypothetical protein
MQLDQGRYKCNWCGADLDLPSEARATTEIVTEHDDVDVRTILVNGEERHRCERPREHA